MGKEISQSIGNPVIIASGIFTILRMTIDPVFQTDFTLGGDETDLEMRPLLDQDFTGILGYGLPGSFGGEIENFTNLSPGLGLERGMESAESFTDARGGFGKENSPGIQIRSHLFY